jgi:hypothetical protein
MERELFKAFLAQREKRSFVHRGWFRRMSRCLFRQLYGVDNENIFVFFYRLVYGLSATLGYFVSCVDQAGIPSPRRIPPPRHQLASIQPPPLTATPSSPLYREN